MTDLLKTLKDAAEKATPGPYKYCEQDYSVRSLDGKIIPYDNVDQHYKAAANPQTILRLLRVIEVQREVLELYSNKAVCRQILAPLDLFAFEERRAEAIGNCARETLTLADRILSCGERGEEK